MCHLVGVFFLNHTIGPRSLVLCPHFTGPAILACRVCGRGGSLGLVHGGAVWSYSCASWRNTPTCDDTERLYIELLVEVRQYGPERAVWRGKNNQFLIEFKAGGHAWAKAQFLPQLRMPSLSYIDCCEIIKLRQLYSIWYVKNSSGVTRVVKRRGARVAYFAAVLYRVRSFARSLR